MLTNCHAKLRSVRVGEENRRNVLGMSNTLMSNTLPAYEAPEEYAEAE